MRMPRRAPASQTRRCKGCSRTLGTVTPFGAHEVVCECGVVADALFSSEEEYRVFEPDQQEKRRAEVYRCDEEATVGPPAASVTLQRW